MAVERVETHLSLLLLADNQGREVFLKTLILRVYVRGDSPDTFLLQHMI